MNKNKWFLNGGRGSGRTFRLLCETYENKIADLEKENAELKEAIKHFNPCGEWNDDVHDCEFRHYAIEYGSKLTKAKEIIKTFLGFAEAFGYSPSMDKFISDTEQFLSEVEK